jgi:hypothetical protein
MTVANGDLVSLIVCLLFDMLASCSQLLLVSLLGGSHVATFRVRNVTMKPVCSGNYIGMKVKWM